LFSLKRRERAEESESRDLGREREREIRGKQTPGSTAPSSETKQKPEERRWRPAVWLGGRNRRAGKKKNIAGEMGCLAGERKPKKKNIAGEMGCVAGKRKKKLYIASRRDVVRGRREKKNYILPAGEGKKNYILPAGEMGCVAGEGKKIIYCRPARWGAWPAREKKNYVLPAGEMGCVAGEEKKIYIAGEIAACPAGEKIIIKIKNKKIVDMWLECTGI
jgi:hypothetical protein